TGTPAIRTRRPIGPSSLRRIVHVSFLSECGTMVRSVTHLDDFAGGRTRQRAGRSMRRFFGFRSVTPPATPREVAADGEPPAWPRCAVSLAGDAGYGRYRVCGACGAHLAIGSRQRIEALVDEGSFRETLAKVYSADPLAFADDAPYRRRLEEQRRVT